MAGVTISRRIFGHRVAYPAKGEAVRKPMARVFVVSTAVAIGAGVFGASSASAEQTTVGAGSSFVVEPPAARYVADLDAQELTEQIRDWAVLGTVTRLGATPEQAAAATYELPPARLPYLDSLYAFEYGRGRRAYLGSRVLLFRDGNDPDPQTTIGRLADRIREENGKIPEKVEIYLVWDQRDNGTIRIERAADVTGAELFSTAYGYVEGTVDTADSLEAMLARVDDLSFAQFGSGHLVVGGRRFAKTRTANVSVEDIAALYKAHEKFAAPRVQARTTIQALPPQTRKVVDRAVALLAAGNSHEAKRILTELVAQSPSAMRQMDAIIDAVVTSASPARGPGFSLDPKWLPNAASPGSPLLLARLRAFAAHPCAEVDAAIRRAAALEQAEPDPARRTSTTRRALQLREEATAANPSLGTAAVCAALQTLAPKLAPVIAKIAAAAPDDWDVAIVGFRKLETDWFMENDGQPQAVATRLAFRMLNYYESDTRVQCARYEETDGTGVGMTMFYTDLLMKLWMSVDHGESAPILDVTGFVSEPRIELTPELAASVGTNRNTRFWLGPRGTGVSRTGTAGTSLLFEHEFTRVYAAGADLSTPGTEVRPNEVARRGVSWWDHHYDQIADYEQEFHRLNQIMKWSLVTGALVSSRSASYLHGVQVDKTEDFDHWYHDNQARLRFTGSLPAPRETPAGKYCLPIFESSPLTIHGLAVFAGGIYGGVSAATDESIRVVPVVDTTRRLGSRKPPAVNLLGDNTGTAIRVTPRRSGTLVVFDRAAGTPTLAGGRDIALGTPTVSFKPGARRGALQVVAGEPRHPIGVVDAEFDGDRVKLTWHDRAVERSRYGADQPPKTLDDADEAVSHGDVLSAAGVYETVVRRDPGTTLDRVREIVVDSAHRRPVAVLKALNAIAASSEQLSPAAREMLEGALSTIATPSAAEYAVEALASGQPLASSGGTLVTERGSIILTRDITTLPTASTPVPPATDLTQRGVFLDKNLIIGQEGPIHDLGTQAARWQKRARVRMRELREHPVGRIPDEMAETSTGTRFEYVPPREPPENGIPLMPIVIQQCDDSHRTPQTSDDC